LALEAKTIVKVKRSVVDVCLFSSQLGIILLFTLYLIGKQSLRVIGQVVNSRLLVFCAVIFLIHHELLTCDCKAPQRYISVKTVEAQFKQV